MSTPPLLYTSNKIVTKSRFRWVQCQLDRLGKLRTPGAIIEALKMLPNTLNKTYEEHLLRIDSDEDKSLARDILTLLSISLKPLTLKEICEALQITLQMPHRDNSRQLPNHTDILSICGSLLSYDHSHKTVALAHHSVQAYLTSDHLEGPVAYYRVDKIAAHGQWATKCLTYLMYDEFSSGPCSDFEQRCTDYPFLLYATHNWALHMQNLGDHLDSSLLALLTPFLGLRMRHQQSCPNFVAWLQALLPGATYAWDTPPLYYAASFGLLPIVKVLLDNGADGEARGGRCGSSVLGIAIFRGHHVVVRMLLDYGVNPWKVVENNHNAFEWVAWLGNPATMEVLRTWLKETPGDRSLIPDSLGYKKGTIGSRWELRHLAGSPGGGGGV